MQLSIVLPCYNEEKAISPVLDQLLLLKHRLHYETKISALEIIVVNDGSFDSSEEILNTYKNNIRIITHEKTIGYGSALKSGFLQANGDFLAILDMDNTYDPNEFIELLKAIQDHRFGMVCGNRLHDLKHMPFTRKVGNFFFRAMIRTIFGKEVEDSCTGQRIFHRKYLEILQRFTPDHLDFSLAATLLFLSFEWPFLEIPIRYRRRIGKSKLKIFQDGLRFSFRILYFWLGYRLKFFKKDIQRIHAFYYYPNS